LDDSSGIDLHRNLDGRMDSEGDLRKDPFSFDRYSAAHVVAFLAAVPVWRRDPSSSSPKRRVDIHFKDGKKLEVWSAYADLKQVCDIVLDRAPKDIEQTMWTGRE
jgi:hypothetical protein